MPVPHLPCLSKAGPGICEPPKLKQPLPPLPVTPSGSEVESAGPGGGWKGSREAWRRPGPTHWSGGTSHKEAAESNQKDAAHSLPGLVRARGMPWPACGWCREYPAENPRTRTEEPWSRLLWETAPHPPVPGWERRWRSNTSTGCGRGLSGRTPRRAAPRLRPRLAGWLQTPRAVCGHSGEDRSTKEEARELGHYGEEKCFSMITGRGDTASAEWRSNLSPGRPCHPSPFAG
nr:uncharacterized protein LOC112909209 isoform X2 [Vulpes vulpes]